MASTLKRYLNFRTVGLVAVYIVILVASYVGAFYLRFDFNLPASFYEDMVSTIWWVVMLQLMLLFGFGQVDSILSYFRLPDVLRLFAALFISSLVLISMWYVYHGDGVPPRSVVMSDLLLALFSISGLRILLRIKESRKLEDWFADKNAESVLIVGAGEVGASLCTELMNKTRLQMRPVAFIDDDPSKIGRYVHGVLVADNVEGLAKAAKRYAATKVIIAFPSASVARVRVVTELAQSVGLTVETVPSLGDIVSGRASMTQLRPVQLEDLLGRDPVDLNDSGIREMLAGKRILVTGAGGSIGSELVEQILTYAPAAMHCVDQAEIAIFNLQQSVLSPTESGTQVSTQVVDILDRGGMAALFKSFQPQVVFHAAAHKHVNLMEQQPAEALKNNFLATRLLAELATGSQVERFILISTDKAINPTSVMGASKRLAELALQAQQQVEGNQTQFMAVRFGNVLGSSGSVIPIFRRQIEQGGPVTVTDPEVTRFFMTVEEAVGLVLQSATLGQGGEIFVLDMGQAVKILDVARQMIALSGLSEGSDIEIVFTGLKPGEKLYEELQHTSEALQPTTHPRVLRFLAATGTTTSLDSLIEQLTGTNCVFEANALKRAIVDCVPEYSPYFE